MRRSCHHRAVWFSTIMTSAKPRSASRKTSRWRGAAAPGLEDGMGSTLLRHCLTRAGRAGARAWAVGSREVSSPAAIRRDLALALAEDRLAEHAEHFLAVGEAHLADREPRRLFHEDLRQPRRGHVPHLNG